MAGPRAILFDLDGTLIWESQKRIRYLEALAGDYAAAFAPFTPAEAAARLERQFEIFWSDGERHREWRRRPLIEARRHIADQAFAALRAAGASGAAPELAHELAERFHAERQAQTACAPGAHATLAAFRERGVALALVTNGSGESQREKIAAFSLGGYFDHIQIEGEAGFGKPEERAYRHALAALGVAAEAAWMVGDNLEWEVAAPQRLGIAGVWCDHHADGLPADAAVVPDRIVRALAELLDYD